MIQAPNGSAKVEPTIIVVDDSAVSLRVLERALLQLDGVEIKTFNRPNDALMAFREGPCHLLITDYEMPQMSGLELMKACRLAAAGVDVPMMVVTISFDRELRHAAYELGAVDFLTKPIDADEVRARARNMVALGLAHRQLADRSRSLADQVQEATALITRRERETILRLSLAAEYRDWETGQHTLRIAEIAGLIATEMKLDATYCQELVLAAPLHDVGKIGIPDSILRKPDRFDAQELAIMQTHTKIGHRILCNSESSLLQLGADIALAHHEKWDGTGYPNKLAGIKIPLAGRIVAVADVFDAVTTPRPYQPVPWTPEEAKAYIVEGSGTHFDPSVVKAFVSAWSAIRQTHARMQDNAVPVEYNVGELVQL